MVLICKTLSPLYQSFAEIGTICQCIFDFVIVSPWKRVWPFIWPNLNPLYQRMLYAKWFLGRFLNFVNVFLQFHNWSSLEKGVVLHLNKLENSLHPGMLCAKFGWNWPNDSWQEMKIWKNYRWMTGDQKSSLKHKDHYLLLMVILL